MKIEVANGGQGSVKWKIEGTGADAPWLSISQTEGETALYDEVVFRVNGELLLENGVRQC